MQSDIYPELVAQFTEALADQKSNKPSGTIEAIRLKKELERGKISGGIHAIFKRSTLEAEVKKLLLLEREIMMLLENIILDRETDGDSVEFTSRDGKLSGSVIYSRLKELYTIRYGEQEAMRLDKAFIQNGKTTPAKLTVEYTRRAGTLGGDMSTENFFIKRIYFREE